jgi:hypothetical protein
MKNVTSFVVGIFASIVLCSGCPPTPPVPPGPGPSPTPATCAGACSTLRDLGCPEGLSADCQSTCETTSSRINYHLDCLAGAGSVAAAQACGSVDCDVQVEATVGTCSSACAQVKKFGCPEATDCLATCAKDSAKINLKLLCLTRAKTKAALQACGSVACK